MQTPRPKFICPSCRTPYDLEQNFCGRCGSDMRQSPASRRRALPAQERGAADSWDREPGPADSDLAERTRQGRRARDHDRWLGTVVDNRYRVIEVIGRGGMGVVYRIEHLRMGKIAAMKVLHHDLESDPEVSRRFRTEAAAVSRLTHHNTVQVFDFGAAHGALYLVMEYVRGRDVGSLIDRDGPMSFERAAPLIGQVAAALTEAHELGVIHRDLKPENILVTRTHGGQDFVKVLDFGLAKLGEQGDPGDSASGDRLINTGKAIVGTPYYMSPEQIRGDPVDARADVYSLGALMYKLLTAEPPFRAKTPVGVLTKHLTEPLVPPTERRPDLDLPPEIDAVIARAMAKSRHERYSDVALLAADLAAIYEGEAGASTGRPMSRVWPLPGDGLAGESRAADAVDYGIDSALRLRRSDLDGFERALRRRRWTRTLLVPAILAVAGAGAYLYVRHLDRRPVTAEREPNSQIDAANRIALGAPVSGLIGKRMSRHQPDRDFFRVLTGGQPGLVSAQVSPIPNVDIALYLYEPSGRLIDDVDENGVGAGEASRNRWFDGELVVMVTEAHEPGSLPTENVSDAYELVVTVGPAEADREREPNDSASAATRLAPGATVRGYLDRRSDVDLYRFTGTAARYRLVIEGAEELAIRWSAGEQGGTERDAIVELETDSILRLERAERAPDRDAPLPGATTPYDIRLTPSP
jgi:serine/threonine-protein kinase